MSNWLERFLSAEPGFERELVERYGQRLLELARRQLPEQVRRRVDPEDVVQSVYRSFFQRLHEGRFSFDDSGELWRLLAAMTFQKAREAGKFHQRKRRDVRRDRSLGTAGPAHTPIGQPDVEPGPEDLAALLECLEKLVERVPEKYRDIAVLRLEGDSVQEIARKVKRSTRTVFRALAELEGLAAQLLGLPS